MHLYDFKFDLVFPGLRVIFFPFQMVKDHLQHKDQVNREFLNIYLRYKDRKFKSYTCYLKIFKILPCKLCKKN